MNCTPPGTINEIFACFGVGNMVNLIPVLVLVGLVTFLVGVLRFVRAGDNEEARQSGRNVMIFGIVVLFMMVSFWGFVHILSQTFLGHKATLPNYLPIKK